MAMLTTNQLVALAEDVVKISIAAGREIMSVYSDPDVKLKDKADKSPLTVADLKAHNLIVAALDKLSPQLPILSEESMPPSFADRSKWDAYWLVDPLDGTKEFLSRNGEFTVNIALIQKHKPVLGVVYVPANETVYWGVPGAGAFRAVGAAAAQPIQVTKSAARPLRIVGSRSHAGGSLEGYLSRVGEHVMVPTGSSLKLCLIAEGKADLYPRLGPTSEWDTAAAHGIVVAAGGDVITTNGEPLQYNAKDDILNPAFIVFGDKARNWLQPLQA